MGDFQHLMGEETDDQGVGCNANNLGLIIDRMMKIGRTLNAR